MAAVQDRLEMEVAASGRTCGSDLGNEFVRLHQLTLPGPSGTPPLLLQRDKNKSAW